MRIIRRYKLDPPEFAVRGCRGRAHSDGHRPGRDGLRNGFMQVRSENALGEESYRFFTREQIDRILRDGARQGRSGSHAAIERILKHEPGLERAELWKRIRRLKQGPRTVGKRRSVWSSEDDELLRVGYGAGAAEKRNAIQELLKKHPDWPSSAVWKRAAKLGITHKRTKRGEERRFQHWSEDEDQKLLSLAGEKRPSVIAKMLHRSPHAIRCRLAWLGKKTRVHYDGYARRALAEELHMGRHTIQRLIAEGFLEVRDPRITRRSIAELTKSGAFLNRQLDGMNHRSTATQPPDVTPVPEAVSPDSRGARMEPPRATRAKRLWAEVARRLTVDRKVVERWIAQGALKLYDPRITEQSFRKFCREHGALINDEFLNRETRAWLRSSMDWDRSAGKDVAEHLAVAREHALIIRRCSKCGREIRGNVFFKHRKDCRGEHAREANNRSRAEQMA